MVPFLKLNFFDFFFLYFPDTTTHVSPERPESQRSIASDINMVSIFIHHAQAKNLVKFFGQNTRNKYFEKFHHRFNLYRALNQIQQFLQPPKMLNRQLMIMIALPVSQ